MRPNREAETPSELEDRVRERVASLSRVLAYHAGGIELERISPAGDVRLRFTGMCSHCALRPLTLAAVLRPALEKVEGVTSVEIAGLRISEESERKLRKTVQPVQPLEG